MPRPKTDSMSLAERLEFYSIPEPNSGCYLWLANVGHVGHAQLWWEGTMHPAARLVWRVNHGPIPPKYVVRHKCDNPYCVNPQHLEIGTQADNCRDMYTRGRARKARGEAAAKARLNADQVLAIRSDARSGPKIAAAYGIGNSTVYHIRHGRSWRHI